MKKEYLIYAAIFVAGVMLANKVRTLPMGSKIPEI